MGGGCGGWRGGGVWCSFVSNRGNGIGRVKILMLLLFVLSLHVFKKKSQYTLYFLIFIWGSLMFKAFANIQGYNCTVWMGTPNQLSLVSHLHSFQTRL